MIDSLHKQLAEALRHKPCDRVADYNGKRPTPECRHCLALTAFDLRVAAMEASFSHVPIAKETP